MDEAGAIPWGERLRAQRQTSGLTLRQASEVTGFSLSHLSNVERGARAAAEPLVRAYAQLGAAAAGHPSTPSTNPAALPTAPAPAVGDDFGTRLLRLRLSHGRSLAELAAATHVSKSHLGNLERGRKHPSAAVAAACDREFGADGALAALARAPHSPRTPPDPIPAPEDDPFDRPESGPAYAADRAADPAAVLASGTTALLALRHAAQHEQPRPLARELARQARTIARAAARCGAGARSGAASAQPLWLLAARCAEFTGWLAEEAGQTATAHAWTEAAARWAAAAGERDMAGYRWERLSLAALYRGDRRTTLALAERGLAERGTSPRIRGLALRRLAQGHALAGDRLACERALDQAVRLLARGPAPFPAGPSWGPNSIDDVSGLIRASCLVDLGAHRHATAVLGTDPGQWAPPGAPRTRARFVVRGALAFAGAGELDYACALVESVLADVHRIDSETVRVDVRTLTDVLLRHPGHAGARRLLPELILATRTR